MKVINPQRQMVMVADAGDWPPKTVVFEAFYLLYLGTKPVIGKSFWSVYIHTIVHTLQWTWMILGTDLTAGKVGKSRGDRYRTNMRMREELLSATYPWFTQKQSWSVLGSTPSGLALNGTLVQPVEDIWWTTPVFLNRLDKTAGVIYGAATTDVVDMGEQIPANLA